MDLELDQACFELQLTVNFDTSYNCCTLQDVSAWKSYLWDNLSFSLCVLQLTMTHIFIGQFYCNSQCCEIPCTWLLVVGSTHIDATWYLRPYWFAGCVFIFYAERFIVEYVLIGAFYCNRQCFKTLFSWLFVVWTAFVTSTPCWFAWCFLKSSAERCNTLLQRNFQVIISYYT